MIRRKNVKRKIVRGEWNAQKIGAVPLTKEELRYKVNGGSTMSNADIQAMSKAGYDGDFSTMNNIAAGYGENKTTYGEGSDTSGNTTGSGGGSGSGGCNTDSRGGNTGSGGGTSKGNVNTSEGNNNTVSTSSDGSSSDGNSPTGRNINTGGGGGYPSGYDYTGNTNPHENDNYETDMKLPDLNNGESIEMKVDYTKNKKKTLGITIRTRNADGTYNYDIGKINSKTYTNVTNKVLTKEERNNQPVKFGDYKYYPEQFPDCRVNENSGDTQPWTITGVGTSTDPYIGTYKVMTDAYRYVETYNDDGSVKDSSRKDEGYCIHAGEGTTTWGCLKIMDDASMKDFAITTYNFINKYGEYPQLYIK